ncbi:MAG TPA: IS1380 family transposase [Gammaproteobacteria bacterium]|nr:IS1380 family transposase [Gammaproteobacteria bacterium]
MADFNIPPIRFKPVAGQTVRGDFDGGALSSDLGPLLLRSVDEQIGLTERLAAAIADQRHPAYVTHPVADLLAQRIYQVASAYEDGNDANTLRFDPMFQMGLGRQPLDEDSALASGATFSRLENAVSAKDIYRMAAGFVDQFIAGYAEPPDAIVVDMDHTDDATHGQQAFCFYNHHYGGYCYLPLLLFEGLSGRFITAALRPGKRPSGAENAMIIKRVLARLRQAWPDTHILLRGDSHFANPELMALTVDDPLTDFLFGLGGNARLNRLAAPILENTQRQHAERCREAARLGARPPQATRTYEELTYAAGSWPITPRVILKAEVMALGANPRYVVTSLTDPDPEMLYATLYTARGEDENYIKALKNDLSADRTSDSGFLANHLRLFYAAAAYVLHHSLRTEVLAHTELAQAQPSTVIVKLFKIAVRVVRCKDRIKLHLPTGCPVAGLLTRVTEILYRVNLPPPQRQPA